MNKRKIIIYLIVFIVILILIVLPMIIGLYFYNKVFGIRYETSEMYRFTLDDFEGLNRDRYEFKSNKGQKIVGYNYYHKKENIKGMVVLAHGLGGGGHNSYMDCVNYFAKNGYYVFAYDATGNDESEGKNIRGLAQQVIDLDYAISYIESQNEFKNFPIMLFGHSWGAYSVSNVLNYHPEVKAVVSMAGFNRSSDSIKSQGEEMVGKMVNVLMPYINIYEKLVFGKYATNTSMSGFEKSNANIMIVHSQNDNVVQKKYGYDIYYEKYKDDNRFTFIEYADKGHNWVYNSREYINYCNEFSTARKKYMEDNNIEFTQEIKEKYFKENIDRNIWSNGLDEELFNKILELYAMSV